VTSWLPSVEGLGVGKKDVESDEKFKELKKIRNLFNEKKRFYNSCGR
jgi:hypothetical protein